MCWEYTALGTLLWDEKEVIAARVCFTLHKYLVYDSPSRGVLHPTITDWEESLLYSLVDNDKSQLRLSSGLVVHTVDGLLELLDLSVNDLLLHAISNPISVDDEVCWVLLLVWVLSKYLNSIPECSGELCIHNFLASLKDNSLRVILAQCLVVCGTETYIGVSTLMTNINTYQHSQGMYTSIDLQVVEVSSHLYIDLPEDIRCNWEPLLSSSCSHNLTSHTSLITYCLIHRVGSLTKDQYEANVRSTILQYIAI